ncbi:MAG: histone deacetylase [Candidatus Lokiarchaeota archaeon]|nr:histone deacetylase [Candidatus Lokiarchaeota archaeon]
MKKVGIIYDPIFLKHDTGNHPECADRLIRTMDLIKEKKLLSYDNIKIIKPRPATIEEIETSHRLDYIEKIENLCKNGGGYLDADTRCSKDSYEAALHAAGAGLTAAEKIKSGEIDNAIGLVRPPGHHAGRYTARGFCLFNNIVILSEYLLKDYEKIMILDIDAHHGNGTQDMTYDRKDILYFGVQQDGRTLYPGSGYPEEKGMGKGKGFTVNAPLAPGSGDKSFEKIIDNFFIPIAKEYSPDFFLMSVGFDSHYSDPLTDLRLTTQGYRKIIKKVKDLANVICNGRLIILLEGGYNLDAISRSIVNIIYELGDISEKLVDKGKHEPDKIVNYTNELIKRIKSELKPYWKF